METMTEPHPTSPNLKRPAPGDIDAGSLLSIAESCNTAIPPSVQHPSSPCSGLSENSASKPALPSGISRQASPALSSVSSLSNISSTLTPFGLDGTAQSTARPSASSSAGQGPPSKRRKLTPAEKQQRQEEKERKEREKAEQKAKRDEQKHIKDEERRQKNEEREVKRVEKEMEKRRLEEEKEKRDRAQSRMTAFFAKPLSATGTASGQTGNDGLQNNSPSKTVDSLRKEEGEAMPVANKTDYQRTFLPFCLPSNATWAATSRFSWDDRAVEHIEKTIDQCFESEDNQVSLSQSLDFQPADSATRGVHHPQVKELIKTLSLSDSDSSSNQAQNLQDPLMQLQSIPVKYIFFNEDVRPPYIGTYTKLSRTQLSRARRNPFIKIRPDTDYNYDSEAEWEEPEDGEDLLSEGESELESVDEGDEMADFLDDEGAEGQVAKRKILSADLEPICSGLCYENTKGLILDENGKKSEIRQYKMEVLQHRFVQLPIDPFSSSYWTESQPEAKKAGAAEKSGDMKPPRPPLHAKPNFFENIQRPKMQPSEGAKKGSVVSAGRILEGKELAEFKAAVNGSEHTKVVLVGILKKQFPQIPNAVLKETLESVAERKGNSPADKRWELK